MKLDLYACCGWYIPTPTSPIIGTVCSLPPTICNSQSEAEDWMQARIREQMETYKRIFPDYGFSINYMTSADSSTRHGRIEVLTEQTVNGKLSTVYSRVARYTYQRVSKDVSALEMLAGEAE